MIYGVTYGTDRQTFRPATPLGGAHPIMVDIGCMVIIIFTNLYWPCKLQHKIYPLYFDVVSGSDRFQQLHLSYDAYAPH